MSHKTSKLIVDQDNPEWTKADFAKAVRHPKGIALKALAEQIARKHGRPKLEQPKEQVTLRLDTEVLTSYRNTGAGWQTRINDDLRKIRKIKAS